MNNTSSILFLIGGIITGMLVSFFYIRSKMKENIIDRYAFGILDQINTAMLIRKNQSENLLAGIEKKIPGYVQALNNFDKKGDALLAMQSLKLYYKKASLKIPQEIENIFVNVPPLKIDKTKDCYELTFICSGGAGCWILPTSLRPTSTTVDPINGYIQGSKCAWRFKSSWPFYEGCGEPLGKLLCELVPNEEPEEEPVEV